MFKIGEFSKIAQVSCRLLRYYDEIGLLTPSHIDRETGYRFYSAEQLPRLNRILALKDLGLSLDQIARLLGDNVSSEEIRGMLTIRKAQIEQTVRDEIMRLRHVETRLEQIEEEGQMSEHYDIVMKSVPELPFVSVRDTFEDFKAAMELYHSVYRALPARVSENQLGHCIVVSHSAMFEWEHIDLEFGFVVEGTPPDDLSLDKWQLQVTRLPAAEHMATVVQVGDGDAAHKAYGALGAWVETNGLQFTGPGREVILQVPSQDLDSVVEIQFPVERIHKAR